MGQKNLVITEKGALLENEIGFCFKFGMVFIKGFGYLDKKQAAQLTQPADYQFFCATQKKTTEMYKELFASYLKKESQTNTRTKMEKSAYKNTHYWCWSEWF